MKKSLKAVTLAAGLTLLSSPVASFAAASGSTTVQYHNQWVKKGSSWTYYNSKGSLQKGWLLLNNKWYYFDTNGYMKTGWVLVNSKWYYFNANGDMKTDWLLVNNKWYYLDANGAMKTGWAKVSNQWYFLDNSGAMKTGWLKSGQDWYYLNANGAMKTGWLQSSGKWYFLDSTSGKMLLGWNTIDGKKYYFYSNGMATNTTIDGNQIGDDGSVYFDYSDIIYKNIEGTARYQYGVTSIEYNYDTEEYDLYIGEEFIGAFSFDGVVYGDPAYGELFKKIALELGIPVTEAMLNNLIAQAEKTGEVTTNDIYIYIDESLFYIEWNI